MILGISRYLSATEDTSQIESELYTALAAFASCHGYLSGFVTRSTDDAALFTLVVHFESMGSYRRALSSYRVKAEAVPVMYQAIDEPSAFEVLATHDGDELTHLRSDALHGTRGDKRLQR